MKIAIIVYSYTGNTLSVCQQFKHHLDQSDNDCIIHKIEVNSEYDPNKGFNRFSITSMPDPTGYDALVFAAPVNAFTLSPVMKSYLRDIKPIKNIRTAFIVTQHLPYPFFGGNRALRRMKKFCRMSGADVTGGVVINWSRKDRQQQIDKALEFLTDKLKAEN